MVTVPVHMQLLNINARGSQINAATALTFVFCILYQNGNECTFRLVFL